MNEKLEAVRAAIIKAVPEIVGLTEGCVVNDFMKGHLRIVASYTIKGESPVYDYYHLNPDEVVFMRSPRGNWDIIGRPITLEDVLVAIHQSDPANKTNITIESDGQFIERLKDDTKTAREWWKLNTPLHLQSDECIAFLFRVLAEF
jgi:hypothetical protein